MRPRLDRKDLALCTLALILGMGVATVAVGVPLSQAHFSTTGQFSHETDACTSSTNRKDPVMDVFYNNGQSSNVATHVEHHTGWTNTEGSQQWYKIHADPTVCAQNGTTAQRASGCGTCGRVHIRFRQTYHSDATWGITALGTPHNEAWVVGPLGCGTGKHAVYYPYGYQDGRTMIYNNLVAAGGHTFGGGVIWGNTQSPLPQCNGDVVRSLDGKVDYIRMP